MKNFVNEINSKKSFNRIEMSEPKAPTIKYNSKGSI